MQVGIDITCLDAGGLYQAGHRSLPMGDGAGRGEWGGQVKGDGGWEAEENEMRLPLTIPPVASGTAAPGEVAELMAAVGALVALD